MNEYYHRDWDHKNTVRVGTICAGHLTDAVVNAFQRALWEQRADDEYWIMLNNVVRTALVELLSEVGQHQGEWTQFLQEALVSAGERCRSDNPGKPPAYKERWQRETDMKHARMVRESEEQAARDEADKRARDRRRETEDRRGR